MNILKKLFNFSEPSAHAIAQRELDNHMRMMLAAQDQADAARNTVRYHEDAIRRLRAFLLSGDN